MVPETHLANGHVRGLCALIYASKHDTYPCMRHNFVLPISQRELRCGEISESLNESGRLVRRDGYTVARGNRVSSEADGGDRGAAYSVAHHESLCPQRVPRIRAVFGLSREHD